MQCVACGARYPPHPRLVRCPRCGGLLDVKVEPARPPSWRLWEQRRPGVWRYRELLPAVSGVKPVSIGEGATPLVELENIGRMLGFRRLYAKNEGQNPTGSFKDRGMTVAVTLAKAAGARALVVASTGNTAASVSAYGARAGLRRIVVVPRGKTALGKLAQSVLYGADIVEIEGSFDDALRAVMEAVGRDARLYPLNSFNPWRLEGQKTLAYEVVEALGGEPPDWVVVPVGNAGNISAIWKGFRELHRHGLIDRLPRMAGVQAEGAAPLARAWRKGLNEPLFVDKPETRATAIRIGHPVNWPKAMRAVRESNGVFTMVSDREILRAQAMLARLEGVAVEPASAASLAGLIKLVEEGVISSDETVVIVLTGHGLKDPQAMLEAGARRYVAAGVEDAVKLVTSLAGG
ncbi:threonine synthase [Pyrodictium occultum]|uniref:Threonine synthase n=1 Tax=Pyrodictium occultum TaxID=2309 RepID=A0A0V8RS86_PYROC|nr:threonine synthase [Pyrodictium occultum]